MTDQVQYEQLISIFLLIQHKKTALVSPKDISSTCTTASKRVASAVQPIRVDQTEWGVIGAGIFVDTASDT